MLPKKVKKRLRYFRPYVQTDRLRWYNAYCKTIHDGEKQWYAEALRSFSTRTDAYNCFEEQEIVSQLALPEGMNFYKDTDFQGFGRSLYESRKNET
jgi:hypothetical protein